MDIDDERTASPIAGDAPDRRQTQAESSAGKAHKEAGGSAGDPPWGEPLFGRNLHDVAGARRFSMPPLTDAVPYAGRESISIAGYFRQNLPAILIVCIIAAAIGIAVGSHFAAEPLGQAKASGYTDARWGQGRATESPAAPSDTIMQRIEEMRRIAAEESMDNESAAAGGAMNAPMEPAAPAAKLAAPHADAGRPPATGHRSGGPCTAASRALALCEEQ